MKTLLVGNFGARNIGDELILLAALEDYPESIVMTSNPGFSQTFTEKKFETISMPPTGFRSFFKKNKEIPEQVRETIQEIVFPGGGLFAIKARAYFIWWRVIVWCSKTFPQANIILEHQGFDEPKNSLEKYFLRKALSKVKKVSVRDKNSAEVVQSYSSHRTQIVGDRVEMYLENNPVTSTQHSKLILTNAMHAYDEKSLQKKFPDYTIHQIAFGKKDLGEMPKNHTELFDILKKADMMVGERFHSLVLGNHFCPKKTYLLRKPYSQKVEDLGRRFNLKEIQS